MFGIARKPRLKKKWDGMLSDHIIALSWSPDGFLIAAASVSGPVAIIDSVSGKLHHIISGHGFGTTSIAWIDNSTLASAGQDGLVRFWDVASGGEKLALDAGAKWVERLAASPCGSYLASASGKKVRLWDKKGTHIHDYPDQASTITDIVWGPSRLELTSSAYGGIRVWSPSKKEPVREFNWKGSVLRLAWSPDGKYLATGDQDSTVHFWIGATGQDLQMFGYPMKVRELAWDRDSRFLATGGGSQVTVWDCSGKGPEGSTPLQLNGHDESANVNVLAYQRNGNLLVSGGGDGKVLVWCPVECARKKTGLKMGGGITQAVWSQDDSHIAVGSDLGEVAVYSI